MKLTTDERNSLEHELEIHNRVILAAEDWSKEYEKDPITHAKIIKQDARIERVLRKYFRELSTRATDYVNWPLYNRKLSEVKAGVDDFLVEVILSEVLLKNEDSTFMQILHDPLAVAVGLGADAAEKIYKQDIGLSQSSAAVQQAARELVAQVVGKKLDKDGTIIDNPKSQYSVTETTRDQIREAIATSISLGEDQSVAEKRIELVVNDTKRAATIARTEAVNSYQTGLMTFGQESGAVAKEWQDVGATDVCAENSDEGPIPLDALFKSGDSQPAAHPNCRCGMRLIYQEEIDRDGIKL